MRIRKKLQVPEEEFVKVFFFFCLVIISYFWPCLYSNIFCWKFNNIINFILLYIFVCVQCWSWFCFYWPSHLYGWSVEVCFLVSGSSRVPSGLWCRAQPFPRMFASVLFFSLCVSWHFSFSAFLVFNSYIFFMWKLYFALFFQRRDVYGAWEQYLGLEHSDNAPRRAYSFHQVM